MEAIEIYQKINEVTDKEDTGETLVALDFIRRKVESKHYSKQVQEKSAAYIGGSLGCATSPAYDAEARAAGIVRTIIREELAAANAPANTDNQDTGAKTADKAA